MPKLELAYFDFNGGRGEAARLALSIGAVAFEDRRIPLSDWPAAQPATPFRAVPTLCVDGEVITQSNSIIRYAGRLSGLYPEDPLEALRCDEVMDAVEDVLVALVKTFGLSGDALQNAREALVAETLTLYLARLDRVLLDRGGEYFADGRLTVADLKLFVLTRHLGSGQLDHIPTDIVTRVAPALAAHVDRVASHPGVVAYYAAH